MTPSRSADLTLITAAAPDGILDLAVSQVAETEGHWCAVTPRAHLARELTGRLLDRLDVDAWVGHRVITSTGLLEHFGRALQAQPVLTPLQQRQVIAAIAEQAHAEDPEVVLHGRIVGGHVAESTLRALVRLFAEIEPRRKTTEELVQELVEGAATGTLSARGRDLVLLWQRYTERLQAQGFLGPRGFELLSAEAATRVAPPEGASRFLFVGLDGYGPWDPEVRMAYALAQNPRVEEVKIALVVPESTAETTWPLHGAEPIYVDYTERIGARVVVAAGSERDAPDLQALAADPFGYSAPSVPATGAARRVLLPDAGLETEWVARTIKQELLENRVLPGDIAVIDRRMDERAEGFERLLTEAGVPSVASFEQRVSQVPAVRAVLSAYRVLSDGWETRDLVAVAESPYLPFDLSPTLLNRLGSAGVEPRTSAEWMERIELLGRGQGTERLGQGVPADVLQEAKTLPRRFEAFLHRIETVLGRGDERIPAEWVESLVVMARDWSLEEAIYRPSGMVARAERARVVRRDLDGVNALLKGAQDWLRGWEIAGRDPATLISVQRWYAELEAIAREGRIRASSYPRDAVQLLTPSQAALRTWPVVFITGVTDGEFPARLRPDEVTLTGEERLALSLPTADERDARERLLFHLAVATAERQLIVSAYAADDRGRATVSSAFFDGISLRIEGVPTQEIQARELIPSTPEEAVLPADRLLLGAGDYRRALRSPEPQIPAGRSSPLRIWLNDPRSERTIRAWQAERARWGSMLGTPVEEDAWRSFGGMLPPSEDLVVVTPSALEAYDSCPFKYMAGSVWRLDPETDGDEAAAYGRLHHDILERLYGELAEDGFPPRSEEALNRALSRLDEIAEKEVRAYSSTTHERLYALDLDFVVDVLRSYVRRDLLHAASAARFDGMGSPRTRIEGLEVAVGRRVDPIRAVVGDVELGLFGRIDRVEAIADERLGPEFQGSLVLRDYKSSPREYLPRPMGYFQGRDLQLPLYTYLAEQQFGRRVFGFQEARIAQDADREGVWQRELLERDNGIALGPWGFKYYGERHEFDEPIQAVREAALEKAAEVAKSIASGRFDTPPDRSCWGCRLGTVCRASKSSYNMARERPRPRMPIAVSYEEFAGEGGES